MLRPDQRMGARSHLLAAGYEPDHNERASHRTPTPGQRTFADDHERWRWDLNPRTGYPVTRFRVLRTHVQARSPASATCSTRPSAGVTEPPRTTTNETRTETRSAVAPSAGLGPQRPTLLDESALHECHESRGTRYCERHSAH